MDLSTLVIGQTIEISTAGTAQRLQGTLAGLDDDYVVIKNVRGWTEGTVIAANREHIRFVAWNEGSA